MAVVSMKELLEAGVHFGHQTKRWHPKMKKYIYGGRDGIYILDLHKTLEKLDEAYNFLREVAASGGKILFVGTKRQAQEPVQNAAESCGMHHVTFRWLGGMLTNFRTIRKRIEYLKQLEDDESSGRLEPLPKKEVLRLREMREKLERTLAGVRELDALPDAVFVVDLKKEKIASEEAKRMKIPSIGMVDTNCDPDLVQFPIPSNDDAIRAIRLISGLMAEAVKEGRQEFLLQRDRTEEVLAPAGEVVEALPSIGEEVPVATEGREYGAEEVLEAESEEPEVVMEVGGGEEGETVMPARKPRTIRKRLTSRER